MTRDIEIIMTTWAPLHLVREVLRDDPGCLFGDATPTGRQSREFASELGPPPTAGLTLSQDGTIALGSMSDDAGRISIPVAWRPTAHEWLLPTFDGELTANAGQTAQTRLTLTGSYEAPLGFVGRFGDGIVGHRVARESLQGLLADMARRLNDEVVRRQASIRFRPAPYPEDLRNR